MIGSFQKKTLIKSLLAITFVLSFATISLATDDAVLDGGAEISVEGPSVTNNVLSLPELSIAGVEQLYSAQLQLKLVEDTLFLELIELTPSVSEDASVVAATLSTEGTLQVPLLYYEGQNFWSATLQWAPSVFPPTTPLPIKFYVTELHEVSIEQDSGDDLLGAKKKTVVKIPTPWGPIVIIIDEDDGKPKPTDRPFDY